MTTAVLKRILTQMNKTVQIILTVIDVLPNVKLQIHLVISMDQQLRHNLVDQIVLRDQLVRANQIDQKDRLDLANQIDLNAQVVLANLLDLKSLLDQVDLVDRQDQADLVFSENQNGLQ